MEEIWKDVVGYENYEVSNMGHVRAKERISFMHGIYEYKLNPKNLRLHIGNVGYYSLGLTKNKKRTSVRVHRLVADAFIPNTNNKKYVNHIDGNKLNNNVNNLEWCTPKENHYHAVNILGVDYASMRGLFGKDNYKSLKTFQYTKDGLFIKEWECVRQIERELGFLNQNISKCCKGNLKSAYGYVWKH